MIFLKVSFNPDGSCQGCFYNVFAAAKDWDANQEKIKFMNERK